MTKKSHSILVKFSLQFYFFSFHKILHTSGKQIKETLRIKICARNKGRIFKKLSGSSQEFFKLRKVLTTGEYVDRILKKVYSLDTEG